MAAFCRFVVLPCSVFLVFLFHLWQFYFFSFLGSLFPVSSMAHARNCLIPEKERFFFFQVIVSQWAFASHWIFTLNTKIIYCLLLHELFFNTHLFELFRSFSETRLFLEAKERQQFTSAPRQRQTATEEKKRKEKKENEIVRVAIAARTQFLRTRCVCATISRFSLSLSFLFFVRQKRPNNFSCDTQQFPATSGNKKTFIL